MMRSSADYFRSKCSKKGWRPPKGSRQEARWNQQEEQEEQEQTDALDPAGTLITLHVNAPRPQPSFYPYMWQSLDFYDYSDFYDYRADSTLAKSGNTPLLPTVDFPRAGTPLGILGLIVLNHIRRTLPPSRCRYPKNWCTSSKCPLA